MPAHSKIIVAAPHTNLLLTAAMFFRKGEAAALSEDLLEDPVWVVLLLLLNLIVEEVLIVEQITGELWKYINRPRGYKTIFMLNSTEHEISTAHKNKNTLCQQMKKFFAFSHSDVVFIVLINVKMQTVVGILSFMSRLNFVLSWVEHEKSFITSRPGFPQKFKNTIPWFLRYQQC